MTTVRCRGCPASVDGSCSRDLVELIGSNARCATLEEILLHKHEKMLERVRQAEKNWQQIISIHKIHDYEQDDKEDDKW